MIWRVLIFPIFWSCRFCLFVCLLYYSIWYNIRIKQWFCYLFCWRFYYLFCWRFCYLFCWRFCYLFCWRFCYLFCWRFCYLFCCGSVIFSVGGSKTEEFDSVVFCSVTVLVSIDFCSPLLKF